MSRATRVEVIAISTVDFDRFGANMRQCPLFHGSGEASLVSCLRATVSTRAGGFYSCGARVFGDCADRLMPSNDPARSRKLWRWCRPAANAAGTHRGRGSDANPPPAFVLVRRCPASAASLRASRNAGRDGRAIRRDAYFLMCGLWPAGVLPEENGDGVAPPFFMFLSAFGFFFSLLLRI
jgi:hypothetical protein